ncbi:hypothetical protein BH18ACI5_BH18ACI5_10590 [soil metagenome]
MTEIQSGVAVGSTFVAVGIALILFRSRLNAYARKVNTGSFLERLPIYNEWMEPRRNGALVILVGSVAVVIGLFFLLGLLIFGTES